MNSLIVALVLWNGLLLVALVVLITRREQVMRWVKGLDRRDRSSWERDHRGNAELADRRRCLGGGCRGWRAWCSAWPPDLVASERRDARHSRWRVGSPPMPAAGRPSS